MVRTRRQPKFAGLGTPQSLAALATAIAAAVAPAPAGGADDAPRLTGRALVAAPQAGHTVFLTWRFLCQDGPGAAFDVHRSTRADGGFEKVGQARATTTFLDSPGAGTFFYRVVPVGGDLGGRASNTARVATDLVGRDWVEILPAARGRKLQFSDRHFADTDGDGELEFVTYCPQVPSYRGGTSPESYKLQVYELLEDAPPRWTFDTGMGTQADPASGDKRADWDYEWTFKPVAHDIDGDGRAEIVTLARLEGRYCYAVLRDEGDRCRLLGTMDSPVPVADLQNNSRHFPLFARLGGPHDSFVLQGGTYGAWRMWAYDWTGDGFRQRWHVDSKAPGFQGNRSSSHTVLPVDLDGDGRDELSVGATVLDDDGSVLWSANADFGPDSHVDGQVIDDIDPRNAGLELMTHAERGDLYALYDARTGKLLWKKRAPGSHLQLNIAAHVTGGPGLDVLGVTGGHRATGAFACRFDGTDLPFPYADRPRNGDRWWPMDWDGAGGRNVCMNFTKVYGLGARVLFEADLSDAPDGNTIPWNEHDLYHYWCNVDIVGDYREDILVQMPDGSVRAYVNTRTPPGRRPCKWQSRAYRMMHAPGDYRYFIRALDDATPPPEPAAPYVYAGRNVTLGPGQAAMLEGTVHDGRRPDAEEGCRIAWTELLGPGEVTFADPAAVNAQATLSAPGTYVLRLTVTSAGGSAHDDVAVFVSDKPIPSPATAPAAARRATAAAPDETPIAPAFVSDLHIGRGKPGAWFHLRPGSAVYSDRSFTYVDVPAALAGAPVLRTANDDKASDPHEPAFVSFTLAEPAAVYVLYTTLNTRLEKAWLNEAGGWRKADFTVQTTVGGTEATRLVRVQRFAAGRRITLGGNGSTAHQSSMYTVVVVPAAK